MRKGSKLTIQQRQNISIGTRNGMNNDIVRNKIKIGLKNYYKTHDGAFTGHCHTEETIEKCRIHHAGGWKNYTFPEDKYPNYGMRGKSHSNQTIEKFRLARSKQKIPMKDSLIEIKIQHFLKLLNIEFISHHYVGNIQHKYRCDIYIPIINLIIECDGNYWHHYPNGNDFDHVRTKELIEKGFKVLRLWEHEIKKMTLKEFKIKLIEYKDIFKQQQLKKSEATQYANK